MVIDTLLCFFITPLTLICSAMQCLFDKNFTCKGRKNPTIWQEATRKDKQRVEKFSCFAWCHFKALFKYLNFQWYWFRLADFEHCGLSFEQVHFGLWLNWVNYLTGNCSKQSAATLISSIVPFFPIVLHWSFLERC